MNVKQAEREIAKHLNIEIEKVAPQIKSKKKRILNILNDNKLDAAISKCEDISIILALFKIREIIEDK